MFLWESALGGMKRLPGWADYGKLRIEMKATVGKEEADGRGEVGQDGWGEQSEGGAMGGGIVRSLPCTWFRFKQI